MIFGVMDMKMQIKEFADFMAVSVRTLHYYHEIGLLEPAWVDKETGYRYYDEKSLLRMQQILFYRELDFPLKRIAEILSSAEYDANQALKAQKNLLILKKERLERLIAAVDGALKGENVMKAFENDTYEQYKEEVKEKWGQTEAYREYSNKSKDYTRKKQSDLQAGMEEIFGEFARCMKQGEEPTGAAAQELAARLQRYITENFYTCTPQILAGLGQMYVLDERFRSNIDQNGDGTAQFVSEAIACYCRK